MIHLVDNTIQQVVLAASHYLQNQVDNPQWEAELLLAHILKKDRSYLYAYPKQIIPQTLLLPYCEYVHRRYQKEPLAYITNHKEFWSLDLYVNSETLIPRPESELLVEHALHLMDKQSPIKMVDLGTGSGAIALALAHERPDWEIVATDINPKALQIAKKNAQSHCVSSILFIESNWCENLESTDFDLIVSNPPYLAENEWLTYSDGLKFEPRSALLSGPFGFDAFKVILATAKNHLKSGGCLMLEHGFQQAIDLRAQFLAAGYEKVESIRDLAGHERVTLGYWNFNFF